MCASRERHHHVIQNLAPDLVLQRGPFHRPLRKCQQSPTPAGNGMVLYGAPRNLRGWANPRGCDMRNLTACSALAALLLASATAAHAQQNARYCWLGSESGGLTCAYRTVGQCLGTLPGADNTGSCVLNPLGFYRRPVFGVAYRTPGYRTSAYRASAYRTAAYRASAYPASAYRASARYVPRR